MKKYSVGFAFDETGKNVVLIQKRRPQWQAGLLNGVGGHVEEGESFHTCMSREFQEETGLITYESNWRQYARMLFPGGEVHVFSLFDNQMSFAETKTDENVGLYQVSLIPQLRTISNIPWLVAAALDNKFGNNVGSLSMNVEYVA